MIGAAITGFCIGFCVGAALVCWLVYRARKSGLLDGIGAGGTD